MQHGRIRVNIGKNGEECKEFYLLFNICLTQSLYSWEMVVKLTILRSNETRKENRQCGKQTWALCRNTRSRSSNWWIAVAHKIIYASTKATEASNAAVAKAAQVDPPVVVVVGVFEKSVELAVA